MAFDPSIDNFDPEPLNVDEFGLGDADRKALSDILMSKGPRAAKEALEKHFGTTFAQLDREIDESKRQAESEARMIKEYERFRLHFPLFLNTERNQQTILAFLKEHGLTKFNYKVLAEIWNQYAHIDGKLDLDEGTRLNNRLYVGQRVPGAEFDTDFMPRKRLSEMSADEFTRAIIRSPKFRAKIDGTE
jgi:hypothetical protein